MGELLIPHQLEVFGMVIHGDQFNIDPTTVFSEKDLTLYNKSYTFNNTKNYFRNREYCAVIDGKLTKIEIEVDLNSGDRDYVFKIIDDVDDEIEILVYVDGKQTYIRDDRIYDLELLKQASYHHMLNKVNLLKKRIKSKIHVIDFVKDHIFNFDLEHEDFKIVPHLTPSFEYELGYLYGNDYEVIENVDEFKNKNSHFNIQEENPVIYAAQQQKKWFDNFVMEFCNFVKALERFNKDIDKINDIYDFINKFKLKEK